MDNYLGEIRMFAGYYAPEGWAFCDGSLLSVSAYQALFTLFGTTYGGNGTSTFGLPDLRSRIPVGMGQGTGLSNYAAGATGGTEFTQLSVSNMAQHTHSVMASSVNATAFVPTNAVYATVPSLTIATTTYGELYTSPSTPSYGIRDFDAGVVLSTGSNSAVRENRMPTMPINFIVALVGIFPQHS